MVSRGASDRSASEGNATAGAYGGGGVSLYLPEGVRRALAGGRGRGVDGASLESIVSVVGGRSMFETRGGQVCRNSVVTKTSRRKRRPAKCSGRQSPKTAQSQSDDAPQSALKEASVKVPAAAIEPDCTWIGELDGQRNQPTHAVYKPLGSGTR